MLCSVMHHYSRAEDPSLDSAKSARSLHQAHAAPCTLLAGRYIASRLHSRYRYGKVPWYPTPSSCSCPMAVYAHPLDTPHAPYHHSARHKKCIGATGNPRSGKQQSDRAAGASAHFFARFVNATRTSELRSQQCEGPSRVDGHTKHVAPRQRRHQRRHVHRWRGVRTVVLLLSRRPPAAPAAPRAPVPLLVEVRVRVRVRLPRRAAQRRRAVRAGEPSPGVHQPAVRPRHCV